MLRPSSLFRAIECASIEASGSRVSRTITAPEHVQQQRSYAQQNSSRIHPGPIRNHVQRPNSRPQAENRFHRNLLVGMPRTSKPSDLMRVMKELGAVDLNFPLTSITSPPLSLPRSPRPYKSFHVQFKTVSEGHRAYEVLSNNPTFFPHSSNISLVDASGHEFNDSIVARAQARLAPAPRGDNQPEPDKRHQNFDRKWMSRPGYSGRTISISGLPFGFPPRGVAPLVLDRYFSNDTGRTSTLPGHLTVLSKDVKWFDSPLENNNPDGQYDDDTIKRMPSTPVHSRFGVSFKSVEAALRAARQLNMTRFRNNDGKAYLVRASVVW